MMGNGIADAEHKSGEAGQLRTRQHVLENRFELRHHEHHEDAENGDGHNHDRDGVEHRGDNFAFDLLGLFHELGQTV